MSEDTGAVDVINDVALVREWMKKQPHLPQNIDEKMLRRFLHSCYYSLEKTKKCIELFFTLRTANPEMFGQRDPASQHMKNMFEILNMAIIPLRNNSNLFIIQLNDPGMERYDHLGMVKVFLSQYDVWLMEEEKLETKDIFMMDAKDISMKVLTKMNLSIAKKMAQYQQEALPLRLKEMHMVNAPTFVDKLFSFAKTIMKPELYNLVHFHAPNTDTLYQYINKEELPVDFGGQAASMETQKKEWVQRMLKHREFFMDGKQWRTDESKRPKENKLAQDAIQNGSFRKLEFD